MAQTHTPALPDQHGWQAGFMEMLPKIQRLARAAFRACKAELRDELVAQVVADSCIWYRRLVEMQREENAHPSVLVRYSVKRVGCGLQVGNPRNKYDATSRYCQLRSEVRVQSLQRRDLSSGDWREMLLECRGASPADLAAMRIDFRTWLETLSRRNRDIALCLAAGQETFRVAKRFGLSCGRISQLRREFALSWFQLHGLDADGCETSVVAA